MKNRVLMQGNIAVCEGAIAAGCAAYYGYPITPQNEIGAYMSKKMRDLGRVFIQAESELAAINMVFGTAVTGNRAMTTSSSPGISLKQEGISYMCGCQLPAVIVNIMRGGPGLGNISGSQGDYFQSTKGGGHGDYRLIVLAPYSVQEMYDLTALAFELSNKYLNPALILADGYLGQMMEPVNIGHVTHQPGPEKEWNLDGCKNREPRKVRSLLMEDGALEQLNWQLNEKYNIIKQTETRCETYLTDDADIILVAFGIVARICKEVVTAGRANGVKLGLIRPVTLWPFPEKIIAEHAAKTKRMAVIEMNLGQMVEDVKLAACSTGCKIDFIGKPGGTIFTKEEILSKIS
jgi:2-oxoglutarate ferredoxin oxidoreductase subunit alpha